MTRTLHPIISTEWLEGRLGGEGPVILDVRPAELYEAGHIPGAISVPFGLDSAWSDSSELTLELPATADLFKTIGDCGLTAASQVVVVGPVPGPGDPPWALADALRVGATLIYAGVEDVAILAGAYDKWAAEGRQATKEAPSVTPVPYSNTTDDASWVSTEYVEAQIGKAVLIDARDAEDYFGVNEDPFTKQGGHIRTARCLPVPWVWLPDNTYRPDEFIKNIATGVIGDDKDQEVIVYCSAGGYSSAWWYLLSQLVGYTNVKLYDGSLEAWAAAGKPIVAYSWTE